MGRTMARVGNIRRRFARRRGGFMIRFTFEDNDGRSAVSLVRTLTRSTSGTRSSRVVIACESGCSVGPT